MTPEQTKQVVVDAWRSFASRDPTRIAACFTEDAEWLAPAGNATARALDITHHMIGRDRIATFLSHEFHRLFVADVDVRFSGLYCDGSTVILEERMRATLSNGGAYENNYCFFFELQDDRIWRVREHMDTLKGAQCVFGTPEAG